MKVVTATSPGHVGRPNEDFVGDVPGVVVLLDGAGVSGTEAICRHGVAWYSHALGDTLLGRLARDVGTDLVAAFADSIEEVAGRHRHTCDLANPSSPQSTVAIVRFDDDRAYFLVLADAYVVLDMVDAPPQVVTDAHEVSMRRDCTVALHGLPAGTPEYEHARQSAIHALQARRNPTRRILDCHGRFVRRNASRNRQRASWPAERRCPPQQRSQPDRRSLPARRMANHPRAGTHAWPRRDPSTDSRGREGGRWLTSRLPRFRRCDSRLLRTGSTTAGPKLT